jgi:UDP-N-acetylmuramoylalanine--D-glutamate ligase
MMAITNLYPEHTPWHNGSTQQYYNDKTRVAREGTFPLFTTRKNEELLRRFENRQNVTWFDDFQLPNTLETPRSLRGDHSKENIRLCLSILKHLGIDTDKALTHLSSFNGLPHRLEELGKRGKYVFVNDSISTIPETTIAALSVYQEKPICLILGGQDRGQNYTKLGEKLLKYNIQKIYLLPENAKKIIDSIEGKSLCEMCDSLEQAMEKIELSDMEEDTIVLLSPAAPSYCQFKNFEERGDTFRKLSGF